MAAGATKSGCHGQVIVTDEGIRGLRDLTTDQIRHLVKASLREYSARFPRGRDIPLPEGVTLIRTTDLALATYWDMRGCPVVAIQPNQNPRAGRNQAAEFVLADYEGASGRLSLGFVSSEAAEFHSRMGILKKEAIRVRDLKDNG